jgi:tetratricopeptide (TPR) repeat protein
VCYDLVLMTRILRYVTGSPPAIQRTALAVRSRHKGLAVFGLLILSLQCQSILSRSLSSSAETGVKSEYEKALQEVGARDYRAAIRDLEAIIRQAPHFYAAYNLLGVCYERLKDHDKARQAFRKALEINPRFDEAHVNLGANYVSAGQVSDGVQEFKKAIELNPRSVSAFFNLGSTELANGHAEQAVTPLENAYRLSRHDPSVLPALVTALLRTGQADRAAQYASEAPQAHQLDPELAFQLGLALVNGRRCEVGQPFLSAAARSNAQFKDRISGLSEQAFDNGEYDRALCLSNVLLGSGADSAALHSMAGACYYHLQNPARAASEVQQAVHLDPNNQEYYVQLAQIFIDFNTPDAAVLLLEPALKLFPSSARIRYILGFAYLKSEQVEKAQKYLKESLGIDPNNGPALAALAELYEGTWQWGSLLDVAKSMMQIPDRRYQGYYYEAEANYNLFRGHPGQFPQVEALLAKSIALEPKFASSHFLLGKLLSEKNSYTEAVESLNHAIALDPDLAAAYYNLALAYRKMGEGQRSAEAWQKFQQISQKARNSPPRKLLYNVVGEQPVQKR